MDFQVLLALRVAIVLVILCFTIGTILQNFFTRIVFAMKYPSVSLFVRIDHIIHFTEVLKLPFFLPMELRIGVFYNIGTDLQSHDLFRWFVQRRFLRFLVQAQNARQHNSEEAGVEDKHYQENEG